MKPQDTSRVKEAASLSLPDHVTVLFLRPSVDREVVGVSSPCYFTFVKERKYDTEKVVKVKIKLPPFGHLLKEV